MGDYAEMTSRHPESYSLPEDCLAGDGKSYKNMVYDFLFDERAVRVYTEGYCNLFAYELYLLLKDEGDVSIHAMDDPAGSREEACGPAHYVVMYKNFAIDINGIWSPDDIRVFWRNHYPDDYWDWTFSFEKVQCPGSIVKTGLARALGTWGRRKLRWVTKRYAAQSCELLREYLATL